MVEGSGVSWFGSDEAIVDCFGRKCCHLLNSFLRRVVT